MIGWTVKFWGLWLLVIVVRFLLGAYTWINLGPWAVIVIAPSQPQHHTPPWVGLYVMYYDRHLGQMVYPRACNYALGFENDGAIVWQQCEVQERFCNILCRHHYPHKYTWTTLRKGSPP